MSLARSLHRRQAKELARQARRAARKVRWPKGFDGTIMWCPRCCRELRRIPDGEQVSPEEQTAIRDAHLKVCSKVI